MRMQIGKSDMSPPIYGSVMFLPINVSVDDEKPCTLTNGKVVEVCIEPHK